MALQAYEEQQSMPMWVQFIWLAPLTYIGIANLLWPLLADLGWARDHLLYWSLVIVGFVLVGTLFISFRRMIVVVDDKALHVKYGIVRRSFSLIRIQAVHPSSRRRRGPFGFGQRGWRMIGVRGGVEFTVAEGKRIRSYLVSSRYPELLVAAVRDRTGLPSAGMQ
jgi:hypothetical protein